MHGRQKKSAEWRREAMPGHGGQAPLEKRRLRGGGGGRAPPFAPKPKPSNPRHRSPSGSGGSGAPRGEPPSAASPCLRPGVRSTAAGTPRPFLPPSPFPIPVRPPQPVGKRPGLPRNAACISPGPAGTARRQVRAVPAGRRRAARRGRTLGERQRGRGHPWHRVAGTPASPTRDGGTGEQTPRGSSHRDPSQLPNIPTPARHRCQHPQPRPWRGDNPQLPTTKCGTVAGRGGRHTGDRRTSPPSPLPVFFLLIFFNFFFFFNQSSPEQSTHSTSSNPPPSVRPSERRRRSHSLAARSGRLRADGARGRTSRCHAGPRRRRVTVAPSALTPPLPTSPHPSRHGNYPPRRANSLRRVIVWDTNKGRPTAGPPDPC